MSEADFPGLSTPHETAGASAGPWPGGTVRADAQALRPQGCLAGDSPGSRSTGCILGAQLGAGTPRAAIHGEGPQ